MRIGHLAYESAEVTISKAREALGDTDVAATKKTGSTDGKSNRLGHGGRAAQLAAKGVPKAIIGEIARSKGAAPGGANYHGGKGRSK